MNTTSTEPIIDQDSTSKLAPFVGMVASAIEGIATPMGRMWQSAAVMCGDGHQYAKFVGVSATGAFVWNTGIGMWATD